MNTRYRWALGLVSLTILGSAGLALAGESSPALGVVINEDNSHFYASRKAEDMTREHLLSWVDQYAGGGVSHLFLCPNAMRSSVASDVWDAIWELGDQAKPPEGTAGDVWMSNAKLLHERGLDPYAIWSARCREKGISPWLTMRMNDIHDVTNLKSYMHSTFWLKHPEYWREPGVNGWTPRAMNYAIPEVREHHMKYVRELLERYDVDGLELDWMRFGWHFAPGKEKEGCAILTQFMRDVRALTKEWSKKRGHPVKLGARVPATPEAAAGLGMDGVTWVKEGLVDMLVPTPFWTTSDFDIPLERWREQMGPAADQIVLAAGLEYNVRAYPGADATPNNLESVRGFAAQAWHRGADQIYLFNYMDSQTIPVTQQEYRTLIEKGLSRETVTSAPRRHIIAFRDTVPSGMSAEAQLPLDAAKGGNVRIYTGAAPKTGRVLFIAGLANQEGAKTATFDITVNGQACTQTKDRENFKQFPGAVRAVAFECPLKAVKDGYNEIAIKQTKDQPGQKIIWAEIRIEP